jgi:AraC-like DNA-binding protein
MSPRTLQRQLSNEKTNFKTLLHNTLFDLAKQMLRKKDLTISEISYMLGYSDLGNFSRSFKKKIGLQSIGISPEKIHTCIKEQINQREKSI